MLSAALYDGRVVKVNIKLNTAVSVWGAEGASLQTVSDEYFTSLLQSAPRFLCNIKSVLDPEETAVTTLSK